MSPLGWAGGVVYPRSTLFSFVHNIKMSSTNYAQAFQPLPTLASRLVRDDFFGENKVSNPENTTLRADDVQGGNLTSPDYSSGLAGVNLALDQKLTKFLFMSMILVALVILGLRAFHLFTAHIRHITCLHADKNQQGYWTYDRTWWLGWFKRDIIYAPLGSKRHNREWQLGKATNYGTLPGRVHTALLLMYVFSNFVYMSVLHYQKQEAAKTIAELRGRAGVLAVVNMIPLVLLAGRNNPLIGLLKISFDNYNLFHRWIGRIVIFESIVHVGAWYVNYSARRDVDASIQSFSGNIFLVSGVFGVAGMIVIMFQSLSVVRHAFYETFLHGHQLMAIIIFAGVYIHLDVEQLPALPYMRIVVMSWVVERFCRLFRILYLNIGWRRRESTKVIIEALPGQACRVTFQLPRATIIRPGSHVYAYLPHFSWWMSHPFSVAWTNIETEPPTGPVVIDRYSGYENGLILKDKLALEPSDSSLTADLKSPNYLERQSSYSNMRTRRKTPPTSLSLICAARTGMTRAIYNAAVQAPNRTIFTTGFVEGAYAGHDKMHSYGTIVMFAGGAGITHHLVQIRHLLAANAAKTVATRKIVLAWSVRDLESLSWVAPWMDEILKMPGRRDVLSMNLFVTKPRGPADYVSPSRSIKLRGERCQPDKILDAALSPDERCGACFVSVCGPGAFADEVRKAVRERLYLGGIDMNEESFTW